MRPIYTLILSFFFFSSSYGQKLVSYEFQVTIPAGTINFINNAIQAKYDVSLYEMTYNTTDARGVEHVASGLVCLPNDPTVVFPLACYQHGTVAGRDDVPSRQMGGFQLAMAFASHGYVTAAPDYVGLGDSPGVHPYIHAKTEASAGVDMLLAVREMADLEADIHLNDQLFISGYSQGGHAAMALQKEVELNQAANFTVTASAPMSGPYDVSGKMIDFTLGDSEYNTVSYLAWLTLGYQEAYPMLLADITLADVFKPEYIAGILSFKNEEISLWDLNAIMQGILLDSVGAIIPKNILQPDILDALKNDPTHPMSMALADNDLYNWVPQSPTRMYYCQGDDQVTYENAIVAEEYMNANGAPDVTAVRMDTDAVPLDHGGCVIPASIDGIEWFDTFQQLLSSADDYDPSDFKIYYADQTLNVEIEDNTNDGMLYVYDMAGRLQGTHKISQNTSRYDLSMLTDGFYYIQISLENKVQSTAKIVKY